jgi:hypothetical protein
MRNRSLVQTYCNIKSRPIKRPVYLRVLGEADEKPKKFTKKELATIIAAQDINLQAGSSGKDIRIQPIGAYDSKNFKDVLQKADLELIKVVGPGEEGSTSGQLKTYIVMDINGNEYPVTLGKGKGFGTADEDIVLDNLKEQVKALLIQDDVEYITIDIDGYSQRVDDIKTTPGTPKSDFNFTYKGKPALFISHKAGTKASDHQQYGGTTCKSGKEICEHPEVETFVSNLKEAFPDGMPPGKSVFVRILDPELKKFSLFGCDYGKEYGINNVNALLQGKITIIPSNDGEYKLKAHHVVYNGDIPDGPYEPVLFARYSGSRGGNHGIKDLRSMISPIAKVSKAASDVKAAKANIAKLNRGSSDIENLL